jgi:hypothetical protein
MKRRSHRFSGLMAVYISFTLIPESLLTAQTEQGQVLLQYLFPAFTKGAITLKSGKVMSLMLNYNTVSERMVFEQKGQYYDVANPETSDTVTIGGRKFIPFEKCFLEVVVNDRISFYVRHKGELVVPGRPMGYGTTSQTTSSNYLSDIQTPSGHYNFKLPDGYTVRSVPLYYLKIDGKMQSFLGEKQFLRILPGKEDSIRIYSRQNRLKFDKAGDLAKIVRYCNGIPD